MTSRGSGSGPPGKFPGSEGSLPFDQDTVSILEALPFGLFVLDRRGTPIYANQESTRLLGLGAVRGLRPEDLSAAYSAYVAGTTEPYPHDNLPIVRALRGERGFSNDMEVRRKDGRVYLEVEAAPVFDQEGSVAYAIAIFRDVTAARLMEDELSALVESLESRALAQEIRLQTLKDAPASVSSLVGDVAAALREAREDARVARNALSLFLANFSHELRTPLNHIIGFSDLIDQKIARGVTDGIERHAANIRQSGSNLLETLNRIIRFAELDTGSHAEPDLEIFVADSLLEHLVEWAMPLAEYHGNVISLAIDAPLGSIRSDSSFIETALRQIVENACKHHRGGRVEVSAERLGDDVDSIIRVTVTDDGPGIDLELASSLLEGKVSPGDPLVKGGLGVGIPLAKRLIEGVGGTLAGRFGPEGSSFVIEFPTFLRLATNPTDPRSE